MEAGWKCKYPFQFSIGRELTLISSYLSIADKPQKPLAYLSYFVTIPNLPHSKALYSYQLIYHGFYRDFQVGVNTRQQCMYRKMMCVQNQTIKCAKSNILLHWQVWMWYFHYRYIFININFDNNSLTFCMPIWHIRKLKILQTDKPPLYKILQLY